jgi:hypothetical protein
MTNWYGVISIFANINNIDIEKDRYHEEGLKNLKIPKSGTFRKM